MQVQVGIGRIFININAIDDSASRSNSLSILLMIPQCSESILHRFSVLTCRPIILLMVTIAAYQNEENNAELWSISSLYLIDPLAVVWKHVGIEERNWWCQRGTIPVYLSIQYSIPCSCFPPLNATRKSFKESFRLMFLALFIKYKLLILVLLIDGTLLPKFFLSLYIEWLRLQFKAESRHRPQKCSLLGSGG